MTKSPFKKIFNLSAAYYLTVALGLGVLLSFSFWIHHVQALDLFFETHFNHGAFIEKVATNRVKIADFFAQPPFGEHYYPGYNFILYLNVVFFNLNMALDQYISFLNRAFFAIFLFAVIARFSKFKARSLLALIVAGITLSPTVNPGSSMSLCAALGVSLFAISLHGFLGATKVSEKAAPPLIIACLVGITVSTTTLLGAYSLGIFGSAVGLILVYRLECLSNRRLGVLSISLLAMPIIYAILLLSVESNGHELSPGFARLYNLNSVLTFLEFVFAALGASTVGKATIEAGGLSYTAICVVGAFTLTVAAFTLIHCVTTGRQALLDNPLHVGFFCLLCYSLVICLAIAWSRSHINIQGGTQQHYNAHTILTPIAIAYLNWHRLSHEKLLQRFIGFGVFGIFGALVLTGYFHDFRKAPHVAGWKAQFLPQAIYISMGDRFVKDRSDPFQTMLSFYSLDETRNHLKTLERLNLWIYENNHVSLGGLTSDGWLLSTAKATVLCPNDSSRLEFEMHRPSQYGRTELTVHTQLASFITPVRDGDIVSIELNESRTVIIDPTDQNITTYFQNEPDVRKLVANIQDVKCVR